MQQQQQESIKLSGKKKVYKMERQGREGKGWEGENGTVLDRQGLPQVEQTRLRTASVDSEKLEWEVSSACSCASCTDFKRAPQSPHFNDTPAMPRLASPPIQLDLRIRELALAQWESHLCYYYFISRSILLAIMLVCLR